MTSLKERFETMESQIASLIERVINLEEQRAAERPFMQEAATTRLVEIARLVQEALETEGAQHKQWYLCQIAKLCGLDTSQVDIGKAP